MTEKEKEAIENLRKDLKENIQEDNKIDNYKYISNLYSNGDIEVVLNLISKLQKENEELKEENEKINKVADKMYEYISYYGWEDFESNTGCNREEMVDYFYKE